MKLKRLARKASGVGLIIIGIFGILTPFTPFGIPALIAGLAILGYKRCGNG